MNSRLEGHHGKTVLLDTVIDNLPHAVMVLDAKARIVLANKMTEVFTEKLNTHLFGLQEGEAFGCVNAGKDPRGCGFSPDCSECAIRKTIETTIQTHENQVNVEVSLESEQKGKKFFIISTTFLDDVQLVILAMNDVTEAKKREDILIENQSMLAAVETGAAVCHEMNQPLTVISGYIDLMEMECFKQACLDNYIAEMKRSMGRLRLLSHKLMSLKKYHTQEYNRDTRMLDLSN